MVQLASHLATDISASNFLKKSPAGIRAQLLNTKTQELEMDFIFEGDNKSFHVINAVSPAFTCSIPFCNFLIKKIATLIS